MRNLLVILTFSAVALVGCSGGESGGGAPATSAAPPEASMPEAMPSEGGMASGVIDHSRDEKEFELRKTLGGVKRMIEQYKADGYDTADLEAQKKDLKARLHELLGE